VPLITELLGDEIASMERIKDEWVMASAGEWTGSITEIQVTGGSASGFLRWFAGDAEAGADSVRLQICARWGGPQSRLFDQVFGLLCHQKGYGLGKVVETWYTQVFLRPSAPGPAGSPSKPRAPGQR
jgi:hypothetical protein